jgi:hypothetical protein
MKGGACAPPFFISIPSEKTKKDRHVPVFFYVII